MYRIVDEAVMGKDTDLEGRVYHLYMGNID